tara:strand:- start:2977 stop:3168 length:192 start_codon:yes stop_codon:yes gene_type:complete
MEKSRSIIITLEKNVSCIKGFESFDTTSISKRLPRRRHVKSIKELRWEKEIRESKINILQHAK